MNMRWIMFIRIYIYFYSIKRSDQRHLKYSKRYLIRYFLLRIFLLSRRKKSIFDVLDLHPAGMVVNRDHIEAGGHADMVEPDKGVGRQNDVPLLLSVHHLPGICLLYTSDAADE